MAEAVRRCITHKGGNPGRGAHPLALKAAEQVFACRAALAAFLGLSAPERVIFTLNTTHALNLAIHGLFHPGDHILTSELEHNATRRPLFDLLNEGDVAYDVFSVVGKSTDALLRELDALCRPNTRAVVCTHASNICSLTLPLAEIGQYCRQKGLLLIADAAQSAGLYPIDMDKMGISALAVPGHKGLYGPQGCGALLLGTGITLAPLMQGGSGVDSLSAQMPSEPPERYEAGTLPTPAIAGLLAALTEDPPDPIALHTQESRLFLALQERLTALPGFTIYQPDAVGSILLFNKQGVRAAELEHFLSHKGICVRAGQHCAPLAHAALGTPPSGAVRVSFGRYNTLADVDALWAALREI